MLPTSNHYSPEIRITIAGQDVTEYFIPKDLSVQFSGEFPNFTSFNTSTVKLNLDNSTGYFDPFNASNFFASNGGQPHGHYMQVLVEVKLGNNFLAVFAGETTHIENRLSDTQTRITVSDISVWLRRTDTTNFGEEQPFTIINDTNPMINMQTGSNNEYSKTEPIFSFPEGKFPISIGSVIPFDTSVIFSHLSPINIIPSIETEGTRLSNNNAEIDYENGKILFEEEPLGMESALVWLAWKYVYRYKRPDTLLRLLLIHAGLYSKIGFSNSTIARSTIPQARLTHTIPVSSSHGRPRWPNNSNIIRWILREGDRANSNHPDGKSVYWYFAQGQDLVLYDEYEDEYSLLATVPDSEYYIYQMESNDFNVFYLLTTDSLSGEETDNEVNNRLYSYNRTTDTWTVISNTPNLAHPYDFSASENPIADNRKGFRVLAGSGGDDIYYISSVSTRARINRYQSSSGSNTTIFERTVGNNENGLDFYIDTGTSRVYAFICYAPTYGVQGSIEIWQMNLDGGSATRIYNESITNNRSPSTVSDISLNNNKWYFVVSYSLTDTTSGTAELSELNKSGSGTRRIVKTYDNSLLASRSPIEVPSKTAGQPSSIYYLQGTWLNTVHLNDEMMIEQVYPLRTQAGTLLEVKSNGTIQDWGLVWRSAYSPDLKDRNLDGYGIHNAFPSNVVVDDRQNLHFISGFGLPISLSEDTPALVTDNFIHAETNFIWTQWGCDLSTKIPMLPTNGKKTWNLIEEIALLMNWQIGFVPDNELVNKLASIFQTQVTNSFSWHGNFFAKHRGANYVILDENISSSATSIDIKLNTKIAPSFEIPSVPSGEVRYVMIDQEIISYGNRIKTTSAGGENEYSLTSVKRGILGTIATSHSEDEKVFFIDGFATNSQDINTLVDVSKINSDFPNIFNVINIAYNNKQYSKSNSNSIDEHGKRDYSINTNLLGQHDRPWAEIIVDDYYVELSDVRNVITCTTVFNPTLRLGDLIVVHQEERVNVRHTKLQILRIDHKIPRWQTTIIGREVTDIQPTSIPVILFIPNFTLTLNQPFSYTIIVSGNPTPVLTVRDSGFPINQLPTGIELIGNTFSGTPTIPQETASVITLRASNSEGFDDVTFSITISGAPPTWQESIPTQMYSLNSPVNAGLSSFLTAGTPAPSIEEVRGDLAVVTATHRNLSLGPATYYGSDVHNGILYLVSNGSNTVRRISLDTGNDITSITLQGHLDGNAWQSLIVTDSEMILTRTNDTVARTFSLSGVYTSGSDIDLGNGSWHGAGKNSTRLMFLDSLLNEAVFYNRNKQLQNSETISLGSGNWNSGFATDLGYFVLNSSIFEVKYYDLTRQPVTLHDITLPDGSYLASAYDASKNIGYFMNGVSNTAIAYSLHSPNLPNGLELVDGIVTGTPLTAQTVTGTFIARNDFGTATTDITFMVS